MSTTLMAAVAVAYLWVAVNYYSVGRYGMMLAFIAYALSNLGFIWDAR